jgi:2-polyprenyl-3-methyl-5-hydroxy-6-metoxy-1,4-benzoquinol methylase
VSDEDRERWDRRFAAIGAAEVAAPPTGLRGAEELLPAGGRALDVACGRGATAVWLAQRGFTVEAVDVSPEALRAGAELAARGGVADRVRWHAHDLDAGLPPDVATGFAVVVCQRFRDPRLYPALAGAIAPGGLLVLSVLSRSGGEDGPYRAGPGELPAAFGGLEVLAHRDADGEASLLARAPVRER